MQIFLSKRSPNYLDELRKKLEAVQKAVAELKANGGDPEKIKELEEVEKRYGFEYEWLTKPV